LGLVYTLVLPSATTEPVAEVQYYVYSSKVHVSWQQKLVFFFQENFEQLKHFGLVNDVLELCAICMPFL
jgi:hypothetical protein